MKRALITGSSGFVGRHFTKALSNIYDLTLIDIKDGVDCRDFFKLNRTKYDLVVHLAAVVGGRLTIEGNPLSVATDLAIDADMFNWALRTRPEQVVYFSSSAAYPCVEQTTVDARLKESMISLSTIRQPDMTYGWCKITGEYLSSFLTSAGVKTYIFRPFSGYGSDQDLDYPFPSYIQRARLRSDPFMVWGDGMQTRDFIHINDVVEAVLTALKQDFRGPVNLGTGISTSFLELASMVCESVGYVPKIVTDPSKPVGVKHRVADVELLHTIYKPKITLKEGIRMAINGE
jgi:nucleoside-diphosphate-sugar epimerase